MTRDEAIAELPEVTRKLFDTHTRISHLQNLLADLTQRSVELVQYRQQLVALIAGKSPLEV